MSTTKFKTLWLKYNAGTLRPEENAVFESLLLSLTEDEIAAVIDETIDIDMQVSYAKEIIFDQIIERIGPEKKRFIPIWVRYAAAITVVVGSSLFLLKQHFIGDSKENSGVINTITTKPTNDILLSPDGHATLTLQDGRSFSVRDSMPELETAAVRIVPLEKGVYSFEVKERLDQKEEFHVFETPKGVSNQLVLSDGTKVWLNASSRLEVSSNYGKGVNRRVRLLGEAYFEVAHDASKPFYVNTPQTAIRVLGTSFNVRARAGKRRVETTLAQGKVLVQHQEKDLVLLPGYQAVTFDGKGAIEKHKVDVNQVSAWKSGYFEFVDSPIPDILEELADWYDIDQIAWNKIPKDRITVSLARSRSLTELLDKIELITNIHFTIQGRRILVN